MVGPNKPEKIGLSRAKKVFILHSVIEKEPLAWVEQLERSKRFMLIAPLNCFHSRPQCCANQMLRKEFPDSSHSVER